MVSTRTCMLLVYPACVRVCVCIREHVGAGGLQLGKPVERTAPDILPWLWLLGWHLDHGQYHVNTRPAIQPTDLASPRPRRQPSACRTPHPPIHQRGFCPARNTLFTTSLLLFYQVAPPDK